MLSIFSCDIGHLDIFHNEMSVYFFAHFKNYVFTLLLVCIFVFWIQVFCWIYVLQMFSFSLWLDLSFS